MSNYYYVSFNSSEMVIKIAVSVNSISFKRSILDIL